MKDIEKVLVDWQLDVKAVRERMYGAATPRERWHAIWLTTQGWSASQIAEALERDAFCPKLLVQRVAIVRPISNQSLWLVCDKSRWDSRFHKGDFMRRSPFQVN